MWVRTEEELRMTMMRFFPVVQEIILGLQLHLVPKVKITLLLLLYLLIINEKKVTEGQ